jgi:hypothetical protein
MCRLRISTPTFWFRELPTCSLNVVVRISLNDCKFSLVSSWLPLLLRSSMGAVVYRPWLTPHLCSISLRPKYRHQHCHWLLPAMCFPYTMTQDPVTRSISPFHLIDTATTYEKHPATLAKQVIIVATRHHTEPTLNYHLLPLLAILPDHILPRNADLSTLRWDLMEKRVYTRQAAVPPRSAAGAFRPTMTQDPTLPLKHRRTTTMAGETTTPGPRIVDLTDDHEVRTPGSSSSRSSTVTGFSRNSTPSSITSKSSGST